MKIIVTGATGMVGSEVIRQAIDDNDITEVIALVRKPLDFEHAKVKTIIHKDFMDYSSLNALMATSDACIWCLGISQTQVSKQEYEVITYDYTIAAAQAMLAANPAMTFVFLSGGGADTTEKSRTTFARIKGKTENELFRSGFRKVYSARPAAIIPVHKNPNMSFAQRILIAIIGFLFPPWSINTVQLANAMLKLAIQGSDKTIWENRELKSLASTQS